MTPSHNNYYELLEITPGASQQEIDRAYKIAKKTYSTSNAALYSIFCEEETIELNRMIEEAYTILSNPKLKDQYDSNFETQKKDIIKSSSSSHKAIPLKIEDREKISLKEGLLIKAHDRDKEFEEKIKKLEDCSGYFLKKTRQYKNISIEDISKYSKISKANILALEEENLENLPPRVFIRGFVLQISRMLGLDDKEFTDGYMQIIDEKFKSQ